MTDDTTGITARTRDGDGPVVVLLHGIGSRAESFAQVMQAMPPDIRLIAWNAPGYGGSRALPADWPLPADYATALAAFLSAQGIDRVILVGHSLGTLIAAAFARLYPQRVSQLVLAASALGYGVVPGAPMPAAVAARITDLNVEGPAAFARARAPRLVWQPNAHPDVLRAVEAGMAAVDPAGYAQAVRMLASGDLCACLRQVSVPTAFIVGVQDAVTPPEQTAKAAAALAEGQGRPAPVITLPDAGHALHQQQPEAFARALLQLAGLGIPTIQHEGHHV